MVELRFSNIFLIDTSGISLLEGVSGLDTTANRSILVDISLHLISTDDLIVVRNVVFLELNRPATSLNA